MLKLVLITLGLLALSYLDSVALIKKFHHAKVESVIDLPDPHPCLTGPPNNLRANTTYFVSLRGPCYIITEQTK